MISTNSPREASKDRLIVILGPTAVGKTALSIEIAKRLNTEIISGDSMLIYKGLNIGSAKPSQEEQQGIKHHIVDILEPWENYNVTDFLQHAKQLIHDINKKGSIPILAGGTGLYVKALLEGYEFNEVSGDEEYRKHLEKLAKDYGREFVYDMLVKLDPETAKRLHINNFRRVIRALEVLHLGKEYLSRQNYFEKTGDLLYNALVIGLTRERNELYNRINQRVDIMLRSGLLDEVRELLREGALPSWQSMKGIGYKEILAYFHGDSSLEKAVDDIKKSTRHFAKRQLTWYRKMPYINWINLTDYEHLYGKNQCNEALIHEVERLLNIYFGTSK